MNAMNAYLSPDQSYRGIGAVIDYKGYALCRFRRLAWFKGARWEVVRPDGMAIGAARTFKDAKKLVDRHA